MQLPEPTSHLASTFEGTLGGADMADHGAGPAGITAIIYFWEAGFLLAT